MKNWRDKLKEQGISHSQLSRLLEITRNTMYKRFDDGLWRPSQKRVLNRLKLLEKHKPNKTHDDAN